MMISPDERAQVEKEVAELMTLLRQGPASVKAWTQRVSKRAISNGSGDANCLMYENDHFSTADAEAIEDVLHPIVVSEHDIWQAAKQGQTEVIAQAIEAGLDPFDADEALNAALIHGHENIARLLLPHADRFYVAKALNCALLHSSQENVPLALKVILALTIDERQHWFPAFAQCAAEKGRLDVLKAMEAEPDIGWDALRLKEALNKANQQEHTEVVSWLVQVQHVDPQFLMENYFMINPSSGADHLATVVSPALRAQWMIEWDQRTQFQFPASAQALPRAYAMHQAEQRAERALVSDLKGVSSRPRNRP